MPTKEDIEQELNQNLGTDIEWSRLLEEDLLELQQMINDGTLAQIMMKYLVKKHGKDWVEKQIDGWYPGKFLKEAV